MYIYALCYRNPYDQAQLFALFVTSERLLERDEAVAKAVEVVGDDQMGHEWVEAVGAGTLCGPLEVDGRPAHHSIAVNVD